MAAHQPGTTTIIVQTGKRAVSKIVSQLPRMNLLLLDLFCAPLAADYSSNPTQCVRFSMLPRFCASSIFCVIQ